MPLDIDTGLPPSGTDCADASRSLRPAEEERGERKSAAGSHQSSKADKTTLPHWRVHMQGFTAFLMGKRAGREERRESGTGEGGEGGHLGRDMKKRTRA